MSGWGLLWGWLGVPTWDQPGVPVGQVCRLVGSGSSGTPRVRGPRLGWQQSPSLLHPSLPRQLGCRVGAINFGVFPILSTLLASQDTGLCQALSHPAQSSISS